MGKYNFAGLPFELIVLMGLFGLALLWLVYTGSKRS